MNHNSKSRIRQPKGLIFSPRYEPDNKRSVEALQLLLDYQPPKDDDLNIRSKETQI